MADANQGSQTGVPLQCPAQHAQPSMSGAGQEREVDAPCFGGTINPEPELIC